MRRSINSLTPSPFGMLSSQQCRVLLQCTIRDASLSFHAKQTLRLNLQEPQYYWLVRLESFALAISCDQLNLCICLTYAYLFIYLYLLSCLFIVLPLIGFGCDFGLGLSFDIDFGLGLAYRIPHTWLSERVAAYPQSCDLLSFMNVNENTNQIYMFKTLNHCENNLPKYI